MKKISLVVLVVFIAITGIHAQVKTSSSGRVDQITTDFRVKILDGQYNRELLGTGWISGVGDYLFLKHGGSNTEAGTYGLRMSDLYGFEFGRDDFNTSLLKIKTNGFVGIGTANPTQLLEINNPTAFNVNMESQGQDHISLISNDPGNGGYFGGIAWKSGGRRRAAIAATRERVDTDFVGLSFFTKGTDGPGPIAESMRITRNGNVGIGTTVPEEKLHVNGTTTINGNIGIPTKNYWHTNSHTMELQNTDAGEVVLSFHRAGYSNAAIKHPNTGGIAFSANGEYTQTHMYLKSNGNLGVGTTDPEGYKLAVAGKAIAEEIKVKLQAQWPDYVFEDTYELPTLDKVAEYITEKGHLPNIPSAAEVAEQGIYLGEMNARLLEKIEELTLYTIAQEKEINAQKAKAKEQEGINQHLTQKNKELENRLKRLEALMMD